MPNTNPNDPREQKQAQPGREDDEQRRRQDQERQDQERIDREKRQNQDRP